MTGALKEVSLKDAGSARAFEYEGCAQKARIRADAYAGDALTKTHLQWYYRGAASFYEDAALTYCQEAAQYGMLSKKEAQGSAESDALLMLQTHANKNALLMYKAQALCSDLIKDWKMSQSAYENARNVCKTLNDAAGAKAMRSKAKEAEAKGLVRT